MGQALAAPLIMIDPFERVWTAFSESAATADGRHDTVDWRSRGGPFAACIVRVQATALEPELGALRRELGLLKSLRLHPDHFLHIMLQELGFLRDQPTRSDEISPARLEEFAQAAVADIGTTSPSTITLGGVNSFQDAVFLEVHPSKALRTMHERLFDLAALTHVPEYSYLPHCTIGHYGGSIPTAEALPILAPWRHALCGQLEIQEIEIVTLDTSTPYPPFVSYAVIPLDS